MSSLTCDLRNFFSIFNLFLINSQFSLKFINKILKTGVIFFVFFSWSFFLLILYLLQTLIFQQKGSCSLIIRVGCQIILRIHKISKRRFGQFSLSQELISLDHERYEFLCIIIREYLSPAILGNGYIIFLKKKI